MTSEEGKCKKCFKMIPLNKKYVKLNDNSSYHCHCFCCKICKNQIPADMYIEEKGFFYHKKCYLNLLHPKCNKCFKKLTGKIIKISEIEMYHKKCFHCVRCDIQISKKNKFFFEKNSFFQFSKLKKANFFKLENS